MRKIFFQLFFLLFSYLHATTISDPYLLAITTGEPSSFVDNCVNVITGDYCFSNSEIVVTGTEPIILKHKYFSRCSKQKISAGNPSTK